MLEECPEADYGIVLEEKMRFWNFAGEDISSIKETIRREGAIIFNGEWQFKDDLDNIPFRNMKYPLGNMLQKK